mgnify:CR=1 FL=1
MDFTLPISDVTLDDVIQILQCDSALESLSASKTTHRPRRTATKAVVTKEWPPPCPEGVCGSQGCVCQKKRQRPADEYRACMVQIHGDDAPGVPVPEWTKNHTNKLRVAVKLHGVEEHAWTAIAEFVGQPSNECRRRWYLIEEIQVSATLPNFFASKKKRSRVIRTVPWITHQCSDDINHAASLFLKDPDVPDHLYKIDLLCYEKNACFVEKRVTWKGLPPNPPEWKTGQRRAVPRAWQPCHYVRITPTVVVARAIFQPVLSHEMCNPSEPPASFWN